MKADNPWRKRNIVNAKHLIWCVMAAGLLPAASVGLARSEAEQRVGPAAGAFPDADRQVTERFHDENEARAVTRQM